MLFLLLSFFLFVFLLSKCLPLLPMPPWASEMRLLSVLFCQELLFFSVHLFRSCRPFAGRTPGLPPSTMKSSPRKSRADKVERAGSSSGMSVLDLPELALECVLGRLTPSGLCSMAAVCSSLRERCMSDHLWERHMKEKWGRVIGDAAHREWEQYVASADDPPASLAEARKGWRRWIEVASHVWPLSCLRLPSESGKKLNCPLPNDSIISWYRALETGRFWFPAQVYNREHGHVGFMLSCYDAEVSYDCRTDTFHARYPPHGRRTVVIEEGVQWDRIRVSPVSTPAHVLHNSDYLSDLRPGDHIEIQWRRNKEFPYGWWYGVVGHSENCDGSEHFCRCHLSDTVILEFNQYTPGSRWRRTLVDRRDHKEEGNETDGFYGGIRKLQKKEEISKWRQLWPTDVLE
ncbi:LOW QUALITY PROTEIN: F-box protein At2g32560-like [Curcuma longa]|uniref:LOW QUALITY PROTEIN: F-box protein At2g32560-like n=1 Tax=Curcuma longa TaxID=136217 RepID=UPI003D9EE497